MAHATHRYKGFTRNQQAIPSTTPAASASHTFFRRRASSNSQLPPSTNHVAGISADGYAAYIAKGGESPRKKTLAIAARGPKALAAIPATSNNDRIRSAHHNTI